MRPRKEKFHFHFNLYISSSDSLEAVYLGLQGNNYPDLVPEMPRYYCLIKPKKICFLAFIEVWLKFRIAF